MLSCRPDQLMIVIPAKDECHSIAGVIADLRAQSQASIVVVDDGSVDETAQICSELNVVCIRHAYSLGAWRAIQTGFRYAVKQKMKYVVTFDADGQHKASEIHKLMNVMSTKKSDVVIGSCLTRGDNKRHLAWWLFRKLTGLSIKDITSGFRLYNSASFERLSLRDATLFDYQDLGILLLLRQQGLSFVETDVDMDERHTGESKIFGSWLRVFEYFLITLVIGIAKNKK